MNSSECISNNVSFDKYKAQKCKNMYYHDVVDMILRNRNYKFYTNCMNLREKERTNYETHVQKHNNEKKDIQNIFNTISNDELKNHMYDTLTENKLYDTTEERLYDTLYRKVYNKDCDKDPTFNKLDDFASKHGINSEPEKCYNITPAKNQQILHQFSDKLCFCIQQSYYKQLITKLKLRE